MPEVDLEMKDDLCQQFLSEIENSERIFSAQFFALKYGVHRLTARAYLLALASQGKIEAREIALLGVVFQRKEHAMIVPGVSDR